MTLFFGAAHGLIHLPDGRILITRRSIRNDYMPLYWDLPGGTVDPGERVEEALAREVMEEVSLEVRVGQILYVHTNLRGLPARQTFQMVFSCELIRGEVKLDPEEHDEYRWILQSELNQFKLIEFLEKFSSRLLK
ncbi:mutator protein MutT [Bradyrhizobium japonicum]